ncbi:MAG: hypothetical protein KME06_09595 [Kastovskya adunca ATA6-11-RM4]|jgi:hypothetical protein|nr:hypothetical protein [Kastovskya adunca ATA6-11-RM4]
MNYEDLFLWRSICELLVEKKGFADPDEILSAVPGAVHLISFDRTHRQALWDAYKIQLIIWDNHPRRYQYQGWNLKGNWEFKIDFLEQIYIFGKDPDFLPKIWLEKWQRKQEQKRQKEAEREERWRQYHIKRQEEQNERMRQRVKENRCPHCGIPQIALMLDCLNCGKAYQI